MKRDIFELRGKKTNYWGIGIGIKSIVQCMYGGIFHGE